MRVRLQKLRETLAAMDSAAGADHVARRARIALAIGSVLVLVLLVWSTWDHIDARLERERAIAVHMSATSAERLFRHIQILDRKLYGFVELQRDLLQQIVIASDPALEQTLWRLLTASFPEVSTALLMDMKSARLAALGAPPAPDSEQRLLQFVQGSAPPIRFSGEHESVRIEVAATWFREGEAEGAMLISLPCRGLCGVIKDEEVPDGHVLRLLPSGSQGERAQVAPGAVLAAAPVSDTGWVIEGRLDPDHASELVYSRMTLGLVIAAAFLLAVLALYRWVRHKDHSARKQRHDLREIRIKLQAVLTATTDGILLTDPQGRIELFNPAAEMMFGRLSEDVLNADVTKLIPDFLSEDLGGFLAQDVGDDSLPVVRETRGRRKGDTDFPIRLWLSRERFDGKLHLLAVIQDLTEHERNEEHLVFLEQRDVLTGLLNRKEFDRRLAALLLDERESGPGPHVLCYIDVDQFKLVNDACGHQAGDELLKQIAALLKARFNGSELIGRLGGDEFGLLLPGRHLDEGLRLCDALLQTVRNFLFTWQEHSFDVAISIGLVEFKADSDTPSTLLSKADVACHMAKRRGRDRIHVYHEGDVDLVRHHGDMRLVSSITEALSGDRFQLHAQPILPMAAGAGARLHFEVLVRMEDAHGRVVIPDQFIPAAERYILMPAVDRWIISHLFTLQAGNLRTWAANNESGFLFAVNLSGTSLTDEGFLRYLKRQFTELDVPHRTICFEITETAAIHNLKSARAFMEELAALGCSFALDDFGTGLSSYSYLRELPVDYLKIDGSFVRSMTGDPVNHALVESINQIGHVLRLKTIAEWAEDRNTLIQLRAMNVDYAQGFGVGEAVPVVDLTLDDTAIPPALQGLTHEPRRGSHIPRSGAPRPA